jgi:hypothetical protein
VEKKCKKCSKDKKLELFYDKPGGKHGKNSKCKKCYGEDVKAHKLNNHEYYKKYREDNYEYYKNYNAEWQKSNSKSVSNKVNTRTKRIRKEGKKTLSDTYVKIKHNIKKESELLIPAYREIEKIKQLIKERS